MFAPSFREEVVLAGERGVLRASEHHDFLHSDRAECAVSVEGHEPEARRHIDIAYPQLIEQSGHHGSTFFEHMAFSDRVAGRDVDAATPREGLWSVLVAEVAQRSIATGGPVSIDTIIEQESLADVCGG